VQHVITPDFFPYQSLYGMMLIIFSQQIDPPSKMGPIYPINQHDTRFGGFQMLANAPIAAIIPSVDLARSRDFYGQTLGLPELPFPIPDGPDGEPIGAGYQCGGGTMLFVYTREAFTPAEQTVAGWMVEDFDAVVNDLHSRGVTFEVYADLPGFEFDDRGIATAEDGETKVAWFTDPDGNTLAVNSMPQ
jgi:catechol 2,3-dioxygenase-like lactoylglutathione lyase family enzyme